MTARHGSIRLIEDRCTSCLICARECPVWCITVTAHREAEPAGRAGPAGPADTPGRRARTRNVLDEFTIDWSLCMFCGICVDDCPYDALEWRADTVAPAGSAGELVADREQLG